jgi:hypothetical protein
MSRSPLAEIEEGYAGSARYRAISVPPAETPAPPRPNPGRVLVKDGQFTEEATAEDRARLAHLVEHGVEVHYRESKDLRAWAADVAARKHRPKRRSTGKPLGRPAQYAHLKPEIERLRGEGLSWRQVGERLGIHHEAVRMVVIRGKV